MHLEIFGTYDPGVLPLGPWDHQVGSRMTIRAATYEEDHSEAIALKIPLALSCNAYYSRIMIHLEAISRDSSNLAADLLYKVSLRDLSRHGPS
jgi:hypothetical protein